MWVDHYCRGEDKNGDECHSQEFVDYYGHIITMKVDSGSIYGSYRSAKTGRESNAKSDDVSHILCNNCGKMSALYH